MAMIKCPECGREISDKAPVCPNCGVEIAGNIKKCPYCGEVYLKEEAVCPHCHDKAGNTGNNDVHSDNTVKKKTDLTLKKDANATAAQRPATEIQTIRRQRKKSAGNNKTIIIISVLVALLIIGVCMYFYQNAQENREQDEYVIAKNSDDPMVLQMYLDNFKDAPQAHIDTIYAHLQELKKADQEWNNAIASGSASELRQYIDSHPDSPHKQEALEKIDSIDWEQCARLNNEEEYQRYIDTHSDGAHYEEAVIALKKIRSAQVSADERAMISDIFHRFFVCINTKNEEGLTEDISEYVNFLGKQNATKGDIVSFMHKLYKDNIENMTWSLPGKYDIKKKEIGDEQYEYSTTFMADQNVKNTDGTEIKNKFRIQAKVDPDGKITEFSMTKIVE